MNAQDIMHMDQTVVGVISTKSCRKCGCSLCQNDVEFKGLSGASRVYSIKCSHCGTQFGTSMVHVRQDQESAADVH